MSINFNLSKEDESTPMVFDLTKTMDELDIPVPKVVRFGAGWDMKDGSVMDVDLSIAVVNNIGKLIDNSNFCFFNQKDKTPGVFIGDDDLTGESSDGGDDEYALVTLADINGNGVIASLSVFEDENKRTLKDANSCYIRLVNEETGEEMCRVETSTINSDAANLIKITVDGNQITVEAIEEPVIGDVNNVANSLT